MKKLLGIILTVCLFAVCLPAGAASSRANDCGAYTLDLSKDPVTFALMALDRGTLWNSLLFKCQALQTDIQDQPTEFRMDLEGDGTFDLMMEIAGVQYATYQDEDGNDFVTIDNPEECKCVFSALETCSIEGEITLRIDAADIESVYDFQDDDYFGALTIVFTRTFKDSTGTFSIGAHSATFEKPAKKTVTSVKIPETVTAEGRTLPVTRIGDKAFKKQKKLTKVTLGSHIKEIGDDAFNGCVKLKTVKGGANLEIIGDSAFSGCKALKTFTIGAKVKQIGKKAFYKCAALKKITIKSTLLAGKSVGASAFKGINPNATIKVPKAVKKEYTKWLLKKGVKKTMKIK